MLGDDDQLRTARCLAPRPVELVAHARPDGLHQQAHRLAGDGDMALDAQDALVACQTLDPGDKVGGIGNSYAVTGVVLTKLDGSAKGGIVIQVQRELGVPVKLVGLGEGADDLAPFDPEGFVSGILGE